MNYDQSAKMDEGKEDLERWRSVPDYEGLYDVSSFGRVRTHKRQGTDGRIIRQREDGSGYLMVSLCKGGKYKGALVHRIVAKAFLDNPSELPCVNHRDENKKNNHLDNLEWCTYAYNNNYGTARERASIARYKKCMGIWPDGHTQVFNSCTLAAKATGITQGNIWSACNGGHKYAKGVEWRYV